MEISLPSMLECNYIVYCLFLCSYVSAICHPIPIALPSADQSTTAAIAIVVVLVIVAMVAASVIVISIVVWQRKYSTKSTFPPVGK